ncbi:MAG: transcription antitermination factor NusB [Planctomycetaceae bacterium]|nr:transcription antitermination factor NusB [Planctomycetaceae bacterium]
MSRRSRAREVALQVLYQDDLNPDPDPTATEEFLARRLRGDTALIEFAKSLVSGVRSHRTALDAVLAARAMNWQLGRMAATDRNVLRLGAFEILHADTPGPVAINEAVELARRFGGRQSPQFVNGILDQVLQDAAD